MCWHLRHHQAEDALTSVYWPQVAALRDAGVTRTTK